MKKISVVINKCDVDGNLQDRISENYFVNMDAARLEALTKRKPGHSVIIRAHYNEIENGQAFTREWSSYNGKPFVETRLINRI